MLNGQYEEQLYTLNQMIMTRPKSLNAVMYLEIKRLITIEDQDKAAQLVTESFH